jgi:hypothetical protein
MGVMGVFEESKTEKPKKLKVTKVAGEPSHCGPTSIKELYAQFTAGAPEMDGKIFAKLCKDCKVITKDCSSTDVDLTFAKVKDKAARKITYSQFLQALDIFATKRKETSESLQQKMCNAGGPKFTGTKADAVKFHDDKSLYTGVHANGGPSTIGGTGGVSDLSQLCDRTNADVRGTKI